MHCLLCHEKIPRLRYWRTKSEFCCDEHAQIHRRQTLERLVGRRPDQGDGSAESNAPPLPVDALADAIAHRQSVADSADARVAEGSVPEAVGSEQFTQPGDDQKIEAPAARETVEAAHESGSPVAEATFFEAPADTADRDLSGEENELPNYFEPASAQHDEPFPVEVPAFEASEQEPSDERHEPEMLDPAPDAAADNLLERLASESAPSSINAMADEAPNANAMASPSELSDEQLADPDALGTENADTREVTEPTEIAELPVVDEAPEEADVHAPAADQFVAAEADPATEPSVQEPEIAAEQLEDVDLAAQLEMPPGVDDAELPTVPAAEAAQEQDITADAEPAAVESSEVKSSVEAAEVPVEEHTAPMEPAAETDPATAAHAAEEPGVSEPAAETQPSTARLRPVKAWDPSKSRKELARAGGESQDLNRLAQEVDDRTASRPDDPNAEVGKRKSVMVCFLPVQGGNGASTVALHVAEAISDQLKQRILLADFDFHSGTLAFRLGLKPVHTLGDVFQWKNGKDHTWENAVCRWKKLDVLVAPPSNASIRPQSLEKLPQMFASALRRYPYVIIDHPDAIYSSSQHMLRLSDLVYLVCTPEITSLHLARRKVQQIRAMGVPSDRLRLIVNRAGSWGSLGIDDVGKIVGVPVSWALGNDYAALRDAVWNGGLVQEGSTLARQLRELGWSVMGIDVPVATENAAPTEIGSRAG